MVEEGRNRHRINADRARQIIESLVVRSPIDGLVLVKENRDATGGVFFSGMSLPEFRAGDTVGSGRPILDVSDTTDLEIQVRVNEQERTTLTVGQAATVTRRRAARRAASAARITSLSGRGRSASREQAGPLRQFDVVLRVDKADPRLRPGTTVRVTDRGARTHERADRAEAGRVPAEREVGRVPAGGRRVRAARREGHRPVGEPDGASRGSRRGRSGAGQPDGVGHHGAGGGRAGLAGVCARRGAGRSAMTRAVHRSERCRAGARRRQEMAPELAQGIDNLRSRKMRSLLTMLGMIFGVGGRRGHAVDRRRRAAGGDRLHRAARRAQRDRGGARGARQPDAREGAEALDRPHAPGPARASRRTSTRWRRRARASG